MSDAPIEIGQVELTPERPGDQSAEPARPAEAGEPAQPADPKSRPRTRVLIMAPLLAVALAGAGALGYAAYQIISEKDAKLSTPAQISGLRLDDSEDGKSTADYLRTALAAEVDLDETVGAVYRDDLGKNILLFGGTTLFWTPEDDLDTAFNLISDNAGAVTGLHDVPAGDLGGTMKCGTTKSDDGELPVCGWADHGSLALAMFPSRTVAEAPTLMRDIRNAVETR
jgi:hypothetical protein